MLIFLRKIRQKLISVHKDKSYLLYAIGEIFLVVVGIMIAVQINNWNTEQNTRNKELHYLKNIKIDLQNNIASIGSFITKRAKGVESAGQIIAHLEGLPVTDWKDFNDRCISIYTWDRFYQINYTFEELTYSGNLALIKNDSVKSMLLNLESLYKQTKAEEDHFRFDTEELIYKPLYSLVNLSPILRQYMGAEVEFSKDMFGDFFTDKRVKNGFWMVIVEFSTMNGQLTEMKEVSEQLIEIIDREMMRK